MLSLHAGAIQSVPSGNPFWSERSSLKNATSVAAITQECPAGHEGSSVQRMPTLEHSAIVEMFRENPELAPHLLALLFTQAKTEVSKEKRGARAGRSKGSIGPRTADITLSGPEEPARRASRRRRSGRGAPWPSRSTFEARASAH